MLLLYIIIASIVPFPIKFYKKDTVPTYTIEKIDKQLSNKDLTTDARADIQWGYEMLCRGDTNEAVTMIERGLRR